MPPKPAVAVAVPVGDPTAAVPVLQGEALKGAPRAVAPIIPAPIAPAANEAAVRSFLSRAKYNWPVGLQETFLASVNRCPVRYMIVDDSGSMATADGNLRVDNKIVRSSRWAELVDSMKFHAELAREGNLTTEFRLLNKSAPLVVSNSPQGQINYDKFLQCLHDSPSGGTPLCKHINDIVRQIQGMEDQLRQNGQRAVLVIATDGESSDGEIAAAMKPLARLPVWVVVRLCTDEDRIVQYWNNIDNELELEMDVLDDYCSEAAEIFKVNPWLTYGEPLHRMREFGVAVKEFDLLDEATLTKEQVRLTVRAM